MLNITAIWGLIFLLLPGVARFIYLYWLSAGSRLRWLARVTFFQTLFLASFGRIAPRIFSASRHDPFCSGTSISIYKLTYFLVCQVIIQHRIKVFNNTSGHVSLVAHYLVHHMQPRSSLKSQTNRFGLVEVPVKYLTLAQRNNKQF